MTSASDLFALQEIDLQRDARRAIIADIDSRLGESEEVIEARETVEDTAAALERLQRRQRESEATIEDLDAKIRPLETRLYDGSVRNPKELTDLQRELDIFKKQRGELDEKALSLIESVETATRTLGEAKAELAAAEEAWRASQARLAGERSKAEAESVKLDGQRSVHTERMDRAALGLYESLRQTKQGRAVARVERGICNGCHVTLPTHLAQRLRASAELIQCPRCERILVAG